MSAFLARRDRALLLAQRAPHTADLMRFFAPLFEIQHRIASGEPDADRALLSYVAGAGPGPLAQAARRLLGGEPAGEAGAFFALVDRQCRPPAAPASSERGRCPRCGGAPVASLLREDADSDALRRELSCGICGERWAFPRVCCPGCGEQRTDKLLRLTPSEPPWAAIEGCASCKGYLKSLSLAQQRGIEPIVDDLGTAELDVIAQRRGLTRLGPSLAGL